MLSSTPRKNVGPWYVLPFALQLRKLSDSTVKTDSAGCLTQLRYPAGQGNAKVRNDEEERRRLQAAFKRITRVDKENYFY